MDSVLSLTCNLVTLAGSRPIVVTPCLGASRRISPLPAITGGIEHPQARKGVGVFWAQGKGPPPGGPTPQELLGSGPLYYRAHEVTSLFVTPTIMITA